MLAAQTPPSWLVVLCAAIAPWLAPRPVLVSVVHECECECACQSNATVTCQTWGISAQVPLVFVIIECAIIFAAALVLGLLCGRRPHRVIVAPAGSAQKVHVESPKGKGYRGQVPLVF